MHFHDFSVNNITGVMSRSLFLLATETVLHKAAVDRGVWLSTGWYGIKNYASALKSTVYVICHLRFFNQERMAYFLRYGRCYGP